MFTSRSSHNVHSNNERGEPSSHFFGLTRRTDVQHRRCAFYNILIAGLHLSKVQELPDKKIFIVSQRLEDLKAAKLGKQQAWSSLGTVPEEISAGNKGEELLQDLISDSISMKKTLIFAQSDTAGVDSSTIMDNFPFTSALMPGLLFIQFGMPFYLHDKSTASLSWPLVNFVIVLYVAAVWIYRQACMDMFNRVVLALVALLASTMLLSTVVILTMIRYLSSSPGTQRQRIMAGYDKMLLYHQGRNDSE
jgi:hypothetical protein